jgi:hypothetical protein
LINTQATAIAPPSIAERPGDVGEWLKPAVC